MDRQEGVTRGMDETARGTIRVFEVGHKYSHQDSEVWVGRDGITVANGDHYVASMVLTAAELRSVAAAALRAADDLDAADQREER